MRSFFSTLRARNPVLYYFGWLFMLGAVVSIALIFMTDTKVLGIIAWIKPSKFFMSVGLFSWTMGWNLHYLEAPRTTLYYSIMVVLIMSFEQFVVVWQAANGRLSHFNISSPLYVNLYIAMGVAIMILITWTAFITVLFYRKKVYAIPKRYMWGIRLGLTLFIIFSLEGGLMSSRLSHTVGSEDGGDGIPFVNWSGAYGDLRVAHFFGIHALQLLPLTAFFITRNTRQLLFIAGLYFILVSILLVQAMKAIPVYKI